MRPNVLSIAPYAPASATAVAASQTPAAGGVQRLDLTGGGLYDASIPTKIDGVNALGAVQLDVPRQVTVVSAADETARTFVFRGRGPKGNRIVEAVAGVNAGTAQTIQAFSIVDEVLVDDDTAGAVTCGTTTVVSTNWYPLDVLRNPFTVALSIDVGSAAAANVSVEVTASKLVFPGDGVFAGSDFERSLSAIKVQPHDVLVGQTADATGNIAFPQTGVRLTSNQVFTNDTVRLEVVQAAHRGA